LIRVLIAASSPVVRTGLETMLRSAPRLEVAGTAADFGASLADLEAWQPEVLLMVSDGRADEPPEELLALPEGAGALAVVLLTADPQAGWVPEALRSGVRAVLRLDATAAEITAAIEAAAAGLAVLDPQDLQALLPAVSDRLPAEGAPLEALTPREIEVLRMMAEGFGNKTIASRLGISEHTAKFHVASVMGKLGAATRTEAVTTGIRRGLVPL
jgi:two-component system, NarL family, response regulator YdfI